MMEKLKSLVDAIEILGRYPAWIKVAFIIWLLFSCGLLGAMVALYPASETVQILRVTLVRDLQGGIDFQIRVKNSSDLEVQLLTLELEFYKSEVSAEDGSLQTTDSVSGKYIISANPESGTLGAKLNKEAGLLPVTISFPIQGRPDYAVLSLDLAQSVPAKGSDRFEVIVKAPSFPPKDAKFVRAFLRYDAEKKTRGKVVELK